MSNKMINRVPNTGQHAYAGTLSMGDRDGAVAGARASGVDKGLGDSCNNNGSAGEKNELL